MLIDLIVWFSIFNLAIWAGLKYGYAVGFLIVVSLFFTDTLLALILPLGVRDIPENDQALG
jgi:hypothetical protein